MKLRACIVAITFAGIAACTSIPAARSSNAAAIVAAYPNPDVPAVLASTTDVRARHNAAWRRAQAGDLRGASREFSAILKKQPGFYPSATALAFIELANRQFKASSVRFSAATQLDDRYLPAWLGLADASIGINDDAAAIAAMERVLALDPRRDAVRSRLELVRFRQVQSLIGVGRSARAAGKLDDSQTSLDHALALSPASTMILRELVLTETARGALDAAEAHARKAASIEPREADAWITLADVLEARKQYREASAAAGKALAIEPRAEWRERMVSLRERADMDMLPAGFSTLATSSSVTRAEAAAYVGIKLPDIVSRAPQRAAGVATDIRNHWAASWILSTTRAGLLEIYPNHTFQPSAALRRSDLAQIASQLAVIAAANRPADVRRWRAARPALGDVSSTNVAYRNAALAVSSGAMSTSNGRFEPTRPATGAELNAAVSRIIELAR